MRKEEAISAIKSYMRCFNIRPSLTTDSTTFKFRCNNRNATVYILDRVIKSRRDPITEVESLCTQFTHWECIPNLTKDEYDRFYVARDTAFEILDILLNYNREVHYENEF